MTSRPQSAQDSLQTLVFEARNLRDFVRRVDVADSAIITDALHPFDDTIALAEVKKADVMALENAFQGLLALAKDVVDDRTLSDVLAGYSPHKTAKELGRRVPQVLTNGCLAFVAFLLVVTAFHYSYWANRANFALQEAEAFSSFDHFGHMMKLVELRTYFEKSGSGNGSIDLEPQLVFLEEFSALESHYHAESTLPVRMSALNQEFNPIGQKLEDYSYNSCSRMLAADQSQDNWRYTLLGCERYELKLADLNPNPIRTTVGWQDIFDKLTEGADYVAQEKPSGFVLTLAEVQAAERETMSAAGRATGGQYVASRASVVGLMQDLREKLNIVHLWALPIIYGALGSAVYSIWRILSPNVSGIGFFQSVMRMIFAGLAALTFSMLLVPSNVLSFGAELNRPVIYLIAFVFGYSIEAFVNTLNTLNSFFSSNLSARKTKDVKPG